MRVVLASDPEGTALKDDIAAYLREQGHEVADEGEQADCVDAALKVAHAVLDDPRAGASWSMAMVREATWPPARSRA